MISLLEIAKTLASEHHREIVHILAMEHAREQYRRENLHPFV